MAQHKVIDLINQFMEDHGQSSGKDRVMLWFEDVYSKIRRMPWSWNFATTETQTGGDLSATPALSSNSSVETFAWVQGTDYIESTAATVAAVNGDHTGRYVYIDNEWYRCVRVAPVGHTKKVYLDKKVVATSSAENSLTFYRRDLAFKTNGIKSVHVDDKKLGHLTEEQIYRFKRGIDPRWYYGDSGTPLAYHLDEFQTPPPSYAPSVTVVSTGAPTSNTSGTHRCFWTFVDAETGQESAPGPSVDLTLTDVEYATIGYGSGALGVSGHSSEETTYNRRLYVTKKIDTYTRNPAYLLAVASHSDTSDELFQMPDSTLGGLTAYYDGPYTRTVLYPAPDEYLRAEVFHIDSYFGLPSEQEIVKLGRQRELIELFHLYFLMKQSIQNKDPQQFRTMQGSFREQLNFLLSQDGDDRRLDPSSWEYRFFRPDTESLIDSEFVSSLKYPF